jgi:Flp pilus assembly secretin CpaC
VFTPPPTVNFEDLGVVLKATPRVHNAEDVSLELEAEFKALTGQALNGIPVISQRDFNSRVRMKFGQAAVIAGLVRASDSLTIGGMPVLRMIPGLRSNDRSRETTQLLLVVTPRLVNLPPWEVSVPEPIASGTETRPLTPLE